MSSNIFKDELKDSPSQYIIKIKYHSYYLSEFNLYFTFNLHYISIKILFQNIQPQIHFL